MDQNGQPVQDCKVELQKNPDEDSASFERVPGPDRQGNWVLTEYDGDAKDFLLRVLVNGKVRSQKRFTLKDIAAAPIVMRLTPGWKVSGRLHAPVPFDRDNTPVVTLAGNNATDDCTPAHVQADGRFCFTGVPDGKYVLAVRHPARWRQYREQSVRVRLASMSVLGGDSHAPCTTPVTVRGADAQLDPIDLGRAGVLSGRLTGVVYQGDGRTPFSNAFGYVSSETRDTGFGFYYYLRFMTDAQGRIDVPNFPPGTFRVRFADDTMADATRWNWEYIRVLPGKTHRVRLFAEDPGDAVAISLNVGDGSTPDVLAGAVPGPDAMRKYPQQKEESYPENTDGTRYRAIPARVACNLEPLEDSIDHWSGFGHGFEFGPNNLMKGHRPQVVIDDVLPGRWRLTVSAYTYQDYDCDETMLVREVAVTNRTPPLEITLPPAALAGRLQQQAKPAKPGALHAVLDESEQVSIEAIPQQASLPTRSCQAKHAFRFLGLEPGRYTLRFRAEDFHEKRIEGVIVEKGKTTWLPPVPLERTAEPASSDKPRP